MSPSTLRRADRQADRRYGCRQARESFDAGSPTAPLHHPGRGVVPRTLDRNQIVAVAGASMGHIENLAADQVNLDAARTLVRRPTVGRGRRSGARQSVMYDIAPFGLRITSAANPRRVSVADASGPMPRRCA